MKSMLLLLLMLCMSVTGDVGEYYYWDDGVMVSSWVWYTGGNYWAVQFDQTHRYEQVSWIGAMTNPNWPDETYQGCYVHAFDDLGGYPRSDLFREYLPFTGSDEFEWVEITDYVQITSDAFYIAFEQYGNYPSTDAIGVDAEAGTHNWTGYGGSWSPTTDYGDFMLRCCTGDVDPDDGPGPGVVATSWGELKAAYAELEARILGDGATQPDSSPRNHPKNDAWRAIRNLY